METAKAGEKYVHPHDGKLYVAVSAIACNGCHFDYTGGGDASMCSSAPICGVHDVVFKPVYRHGVHVGNWENHDGGECPVPKGTLVDVIFRDGDTVTGVPALERFHTCPYAEIWPHGFGDFKGHPGDIVKWRLHVGSEK